MGALTFGLDGRQNKALVQNVSVLARGLYHSGIKARRHIASGNCPGFANQKGVATAHLKNRRVKPGSPV